MLRRVPRDRIRLGMYIQAIEGPWLDHPFWRSRFLLSDPADLAALLGSSIPAVTIDDAKGLGLGDAPVAAPQAPPGQPPPAAPRKPARPPPPSCTAAEELDRAARIVGRSRKAVARLFEEARLGKAVDVATVLPVVDEISASVARNASTLISITRLKTKDEYTYMHSVAVCALMINLARQLDLPPDYVKQAGTAGLFMDIGKGFLPAELLGKRTEFTEADWAEMRRHPQLGADAVKASGDMSKIVADVCLHHHEKYDGTGYPDGLKGDQISLFARMAALCDTYDAIVSARPHRPARGPADAVAELYKLKGHFDETLLTSFIRSIGIYPVGSLVRLESRMLGCVAAQRRDQLTRPLVRIFYSIPQRTHVPVEEVDLAQVPEPDRIVAREEPGRWGLPDWDSYALTILQGQKAKRAA